MKKFQHLLWLIFFLVLAMQIRAQAPTDTLRQRQDSLHNEVLRAQSEELQKLQIERNADSLRRMELQQQLNELKSTDNLQKADLLKQIEDLQNKDADRLSRQRQKIDSLRAFVQGFPVAPFGDTVLMVYNKIGSFSPSERAAAISNRIRKLGTDFRFNRDSIHVLPADQGRDIVYGETTLMSVTEADALWEDASLDSTASRFRLSISNSVEKYKASVSFVSILKKSLLALLVAGILVAIIYFLGKLFRKSARWIVSQRGKLFKGYSIRKYQLLDARKQISFLLAVNLVLKWILIIFLISLALPLLFSIFPWTKNFADTLLGFVLTPIKAIFSKIWNYLPNLFTIVIVVIVFHYALKAIAFFKREIESGALKIEGFYPDWANPTFQIIRVLMYAFMLVVIFPYLPGSNSPVFKGVSVFLGVLFTFGSAGSLSNLIAGFLITYMRSFKVGDRVCIGTVTGDIIEKSMLVIRLRTIKNEIITIPNSTVMSSHTINYTSDAVEKGLIVHSEVTIGYDAPWKKIHELLIRAATKTEHILANPQPFVLQTALDDFYVRYEINAYTHAADRQAAIYSQLHQHIQDEFREAGVEIMSPHYRANRDGEARAIPPK